jgi:glutamine synthetase
MLGGILKGLTARHLPPPLEGNAYHMDSLGEALPRYWPTAIDRFESSAFGREYCWGLTCIGSIRW